MTRYASSLVALSALLLLATCGGGKKLPGSPSIRINEVCPSNHHSCEDETGASPDWIELYNDSDEDISLEDYALSDDTESITDDERLSGEVVVPAKGVRLLFADKRPELGPFHLPFKLKSDGEMVLLYGPDGVLLDRFDWTNAVTDVSYARFPDGTGSFVSCAAPTCGAVNGSACAVTTE
jgi:large repetitive protein